MITVVIPTRNREFLLLELLQSLLHQSIQIAEIIIVDSSDTPVNLGDFSNFNKIKTLHSTVKSAAFQRNLGIAAASSDTKYLAFLDDDVRPGPFYLEHLIEILDKNSAIGCSGIALNFNKIEMRKLPKGLVGLYHRLFLLDSNSDGKLLKSGVNIPVRINTDLPVEVDWLIGCSVWKYGKIENTSFESDFYGVSLAEDVIFSVRMSKKGKLLTTTKVKLNHLESTLSRDSLEEFWSMWMTNRYRLIEVAEFGKIGKISFWWASLGQAIIFLVFSFKDRPHKFRCLRGILIGVMKIYGKK